jgi:hypothetical protein
MGSLPTAAVAAYVVLHFGAIASAWGTRLAVGSRVESIMQLAFLVALAAIGFSTWFCHEHDLGLGIPSGMTLIAMVLMAVTDMRRTHEPHHHRHHGTTVR